MSSFIINNLYITPQPDLPDPVHTQQEDGAHPLRPAGPGSCPGPDDVRNEQGNQLPRHQGEFSGWCHTPAAFRTILQASKYKKMSSVLPPEKYTQCLQSDLEDQSLQDFTVQNIEKTKMVSFSDKKFRDKVSLVVNLASF